LIFGSEALSFFFHQASFVLLHIFANSLLLLLLLLLQLLHHLPFEFVFEVLIQEEIVAAFVGGVFWRDSCQHHGLVLRFRLVIYNSC